MKSLNKYSAVIVFLFLLPLVAKAQHYPVQAGLSVGTPCPQRLSSLFPLSGSRLQLSLLLTDIAQAEVSVRLHVKIEGAGLTVQSRPNPAMPVFMLQGGMPLTLGQQMEPYFRTDNLMASGNGATQFMQNGLMPEGFYTFTVTVFEHRRNVQISNAAQSFVWVIVNDPPQLVTPENNQILQPGGMQNIFFSWLPRHVVNPSTGSPIRYALSLWEVPQGMNAQMVVNTLPPLESVETPSTSLVWGADRMPLTPGKRYVAAVKAFDPNNEVGFKNNGLSVPHSFVYGQTCLSPVNLSHSNVTTQSADISWVAVGGGQNFRLEFKASSEPAGAYREIHVSQSHAALGNLSPNTSYDYRLSTVCGGYVSPPTASRSFTTLPIPVLNNECLSTVDVPAPNQSPLLTSLPAGQLFLAAGFPVEVGYTVPAGPNTFNGKGIIGLPMFGFGLRAEFEQIKVNQALQLVSGVVRVVKGDSLTIIGGGGSNGGGPGGVDFSNPNDTIFIPLPIDSVYANEDGTWSIVDTDGNTTIVTPSDGGTLVLGSDGNGVVIVGGQVYPVSTNPLAGGSGAGAGGSVQVTALCSQQLTFAPGGSMHRYGFDGYKAAMPPGSYPVLNVGEEQLHLGWKSVATGGSDRLLATPLSNSPISFAYQSGMPLSASSTAEGYQLWTINPPGGEDNLLALCQTDSAGQASVAGGVRVKTYPLQRQKLVVVPVGSAQPSFTKAQLQTTLNTIYAQAVSEWEVSIDAALPVLGIDDLSQGITVDETDYSEHQRQVWRALVMDRNPVPGAYYLFIIPGFKDHPAMIGYMPIKSGFGFLTPQADARTAAHELGHGAFNLRHTFSNDNVVNLPEGTTQNLMDYSVGTELWKYQWDYIHNPEGGWFLGEDVGEGASVVETFDIIGQNTGIAPNGKVISSVKSVNNTNRVVFSIARGNYFVSGFTVYDDAGNKIETYKWNGSSYYNGSLSVESSTSVELTYNLASEPVQTCIYRLYGDGCYFQFANVSHLSGSAEVNAQGAVWHAGMLYGASESCFINYVLTRDKEGCLFEDIEAGLTRLMNVLTSTSAEQVEVVVNSVCLSSLKNLSYAQIEKLLLVLASQSTIRERSELAILRLMNAIREVDYPLFFQALERKNNELLIHFVNELHDASLFFLVDETNYTNFIGALSEMYSLNHSLFSDRFPADFEDLLPISVNLTPLKKFEFDIKGYREFGRNVKAHYNEADGTISLTEVQWEKEYEFDPASNESRLISENTYHFPLTPNAPLQPLSPVLLYLNSQPLPLVSSALDGALQLTDNMYIVPAIFLKHKNDKYYNEALRDGIFTTLDVVTIVVGGSTLISGAGKVARIWAAAEVAGAIGNIGSSTVVQYDPQSDFAQCVEAYNAVLALIGVKNLGQGLIQYSHSLVPEIKSAIKSELSIKRLIFGKGEDWIEAVDKLTDLTPAQRNLIVQQEIVMDMLGVRKGVSGAGRTLPQMRNSVDEWVALQRQLATSNNQLREFNTATILYNKATGKYYYGANRGIVVSGAEIHPTLASHLPETSTNAYKLGNCAECDAVNQALHDGANWGDLQMHTVGVQWNTGVTFPKPLCTNCEVTFAGIEILQ